jgi:DNA ligase-1
MKYLDLCDIYSKLEGTSKRLEKTYHVSELIKKTKDEDLPLIMLLLEGKVFPAWDKRKMGMASRLVVKAINIATGIDTDKIENKWKKTGDLGLVAEEYIGKKKQATLFSQDLNVKKVFDNLQKLAELEGAGTVDKKTKLVAELLTSAQPLEAKYIVRTVLEDLRVGVGAGSVRDAIVWAEFPVILNLELSGDGETFYFKSKEKLASDKATEHIKDKDAFEKVSLKTKALSCETKEVARELFNFFMSSVEEAYNITNDWAEVVLEVRNKGLKGLKDVDIVPGKPVKVMLYQKAQNIKDAFERVGKPCALEFKYDGFRLEIHIIDSKGREEKSKNEDNKYHKKENKKIILFTRSFEDVTEQFPDVVDFIQKYVCPNVKDAILDSEAVGFNPKTTQYTAFQSISQRIKRKYDIKELSEKFPVEVNVFDVLYYNGKSLLKEEFCKRRSLLSKIVDVHPRKIVLSSIIVTDKEAEANKFYQASLDAGNEGIMAKNLNAVYKPGSRVGFGVKVKPVMESLDLVITGAEWGEGKRSGWLTSFVVACRNDDGKLVEIGRVGTGIKELEEEGVTFSQLTDMLKPLIKSEKGKEITVKPKIIIEVHYEEIQASPTYSSGYALRFPRFVRLREDRDVEDISTLEQVEELYKRQRGRDGK